jgi:uncharacterized membrane protein YedE/YeeE
MSIWQLATIGGLMIGAASALLLVTHGRIAGISGIIGGLAQASRGERGWRLAFLLGLAGPGIVASVVAPASIGGSVRSPLVLVIAGLLVGFGTRYGSGCTSGHGVCGLSRFSTRSLVAVAVFMATGAITATIMGRLS